MATDEPSPREQTDHRLAPPSPARPVLVRDRLHDILRGRWERRVTSVVAGPGFGKTTLLAQVVAENEADPRGIDCWVRVGPDDAAASVLGAALCHALGIAPSSGSEPHTTAEVVASAVAARAPVAVTLILDNMHELAPDSAGAALIASLVERLPSNGHLVFGSRSSPPIPLARMVVRGTATVVTEDEAPAFTPDEIEAFARLRGVDVDTLHDAGRWPTIAEMVATTGSSAVVDYLWDETLRAMSAERCRQLAVLAAIGGADEPTLSAALDAPVRLDDLVAGVPLATMTASGWSELHSLWHGPLEPQRLSEGERCEAQERAARHRLDEGDRLSAFRLYLAAGASDEALGIALETCSHMHIPASVDVLERWLAALTPEHADDPRTVLMRGIITREHADDPRAAVPVLTEAARSFAAAGDVVGESACLVAQFQIAFITNETELLVAVVVRSAELAEHGGSEARVIGNVGRSGYLAFIGDHEGALRELDATPQHGAGPEWSAIHAWGRAEQYLSLGRPDIAVDIHDRLHYRAKDELAGVLDDAYIVILSVAGRIDEAVERMEHFVDVMSTRLNPVDHAVQGVLAVYARLLAYVGRVESAAQQLAHAERLGEFPDVYLRARLGLAGAAVGIASGNEEAARAALERAIGPNGFGPDIFTRVVRRWLALPYVLIPETRAFWDADEPGPAYAHARDIARALLALRAGDLQLVASLENVDAGAVRSVLPFPWATELAVGLVACGRDEDARQLLDAIGPVARPRISELIASGNAEVARAARRLLAEIPEQPADVVEIRLLGPPELRHGQDAADTPEWRRDRVRRLLAYLVLHGTATREAVADALWPELDMDAGANNLRATLSYLLRALQPTRRDKEASYFIDQRGRTLALVGRDRLLVDVWELEAMLDQAMTAERSGAPSVALERYRDAAQCWRGSFLDGVSAEWIDTEADRLRRQFVLAATRGAEPALAAGDHQDSEALAARAIEADPASERSFRVLASAQLARGDRDAAQQTLERCRAMLGALDVEPGPETLMLERRLDR